VRLSLLRGTLAGGLGIMLAVTLPGIAAAAVRLTANTATLATGTNAYTITTGGPYWSVVGVRPPLGQDYDMRLSRNGAQLASSTYSAGHFDFIAIDSNRMPVGASYEVTVRPYNGATGQYSVNFADPLTTMNFGGSGYVQTPEPQFLTIRDMYLTKGQNYGIFGGLAPYVFLMASDPANQSTWTPSRAQAAAYITTVGGQSCAKYRAPRSGWYGLVGVDWFDNGRKNGAQKIYLEPIAADNADRFTPCRQF
jgi:hypothetical protein